MTITVNEPQWLSDWRILPQFYCSVRSSHRVGLSSPSLKNLLVMIKSWFRFLCKQRSVSLWLSVKIIIQLDIVYKSSLGAEPLVQTDL